MLIIKPSLRGLFMQQITDISGTGYTIKPDNNVNQLSVISISGILACELWIPTFVINLRAIIR